MYDLFYRSPRLVVLSIMLILVAGLSSLVVLPRMEDPLLTPRAATVTTAFPGADAQRVEALVTEKLEEELKEIEEIKEIRSTSRAGISFLQIELRDDVTEEESPGIWSRLRDKLSDAADLMPEGAAEPDFDEVDVKAYGLIVGLQWQQSSPPSYSILRRLVKQLEDRIATIPGTEKSELYGDPGEEILVQIDPQSMTSLNLTAGEVARQLQASDAKVAAGQMRSSAGDLLLEVSGELDTLTRVSQTPIQFGNDGSFVNLSDIATIDKVTPTPPASLSLVEGRPAVCLGVLVRADSRIDLWNQEVNSVLESFRSQLPPGIEMNVLFQQNRYVEERLQNLVSNLLMGAGAVLIVIWFMMGWRSALIVGTALPLSSLMVLSGLRFLEIPIHQMSVTGLIIALGLLIDNAIVVVDEVAQKLGSGKSGAEAVAATTRHLAVPLLGSTLTTALAFGPIALMPGPAGEFVGSIAISVILAVFSSLALALTVVPTLAAWGIRYQRHSAEPSSDRNAGYLRWHRNGFSHPGLTSIYSGILRYLYQHPWLGVVASLVLPISGFVAASQLAEQFFPPADRDQIHIELELFANASIQETQQIAKAMEAELLKDPTVTKVSWFFGDSAPIFYYNLIPNRKKQPRYAQAIVQRNQVAGSEPLIHQLQEELDKQFPQALSLVRQLEQGPPFYAPIEIRLFGPDMEVLRELGDEVRLVLTETADVIHTRSELSEVLPKLYFEVDQQQARLAGLDQVGIASQLNQTLEGALGGSILESTEELPVRVRVYESDRSDLNQLASLDLTANRSVASVPQSSRIDYEGVPLTAISRIRLQPEISGIPRFNSQRMNEVQAFIPAGVLPAKVLQAFQQKLAESDFNLPEGYRLAYGGEAAKRDDAIGNLMANVGVLMVLMVATLVLSFQSFRMASLIGIVAAASVGLGMGSLWLFGFPFGFMAIVGTMGLIGVAINDSIVVLAALEEDSAARQGDLNAINEIVVRSSRHIISTSLTTMAGFAPLVLAGGGFWPPLAIAISGGVGGATILALIFVPSAYRIMKCPASYPSRNWQWLPRRDAALNVIHQQ